MPLVHGIEMPWSRQQRHAGLGLFGLADDLLDLHAAPSALASDGTAARHRGAQHALSTQALPPDSCCEGGSMGEWDVFLLEMT